MLIVLPREPSDAEREQIEAFRRLGSLLGGARDRRGGRRRPRGRRAGRARARSTYVLIGTPAPRRGLRRLGEPLTDRLLRALPGVDVRIVADRSKREWAKKR